MSHNSDSTIKEKESNHSIARFCLEMDFESFFQLQKGFFSDLAKILEILPEEIKITGISCGCVLIRVEIPLEAQIHLIQKWNSLERPQDLLDFMINYKIRWIRFDDMVEKRVSIIIPTYERSEKQITWLHLSDAHLRSSEGAVQWSQDIVIQKFLDHLPSLLARNQLEPDFLFFTGDVAFSGKTDEYSIAKGFIEETISKLPKEPKVFFVPGNHDVTWNQIDINTEKKLRNNLKNQQRILSLMLDASKEEERENIFKRQHNYNEFLNYFSNVMSPLEEDEQYYYLAIVNHIGLDIGIVGFNSSWLSTRKDHIKKEEDIPDLDLQHLVIGEPNIYKALDQLKDVELRIALIHHPPFSKWFNDIDLKAQNAMLPEFHFILRGHEHMEKFDSLSPIDQGRVAHHFASGALYLTDEYTNNFNVVKLNLDRGVGTIFFYTYFHNYYAWRPYTGPADEGYKLFSIS